MFIGRNEECKLIKEIGNNTGKSLLLYGKRRVGKTTLLKSALKESDNKLIYYECLKSQLNDNINNFVDLLVKEKVLSVKLLFNSLQDVFSYLNNLPINLNIVIDEYPYLKKFEKSELIDSVFQNIIDNNLKNINLFISGSHIGMMKDMLEEKNALYGRFNTIINLKELNYLETSLFYKNKTNYEKVAFYSVFGGSPFVNSFINYNKSLKENIIALILDKHSPIYNYAESLLISDLSSSINAERILSAISNGKKKYKDIEAKLNIEKNGLLSKHLTTLLNMELISKIYPINAVADNKKSFYEINDNLLRFYYTYIYSNKSLLEILGPVQFYEQYIEPSIVTFISYRFEDISRSYFSIQVKRGKLKGVLNIGTLYYDDPLNKRNGEFDVALKFKEGYEIYEVKYYLNDLNIKEMLDEEKQINNIKGLKIIKTGFITPNEVTNKIGRFNYINGNDLYLL